VNYPFRASLARDLNGAARVAPDDLPGGPTLVVLAFGMDHHAQVLSGAPSGIDRDDADKDVLVNDVQSARLG
jgi:hypothetical protein